MKKILPYLFVFTLISSKTKAQTLDFSGTNNAVTTNYTLDLTNGFTVEYWMYAYSIQDYNGIVFQGTTNTPGPLDVYIAATGYMNVVFGDGTSAQAITAPVYFEAYKWYHVAHTYNPATQEAKFYVNGVNYGTWNVTWPVASSDNTLYIGNRPDNITDANIRMKDLKVWSGERTPTMSTCLTGTEPGLEVYYNMNEGSGTTLNDLAPAAGTNNGSFMNALFWNSVQTPSVIVNTASTFVMPSSPTVFTATISGDIFGEHYQWYKNNVPVGTDSTVYVDSTLLNNDTVYVVLSASIPCLPQVTSLASDSVGITVLPPNTIFYPAGGYCYSVGNLEFCDILYLGETDYYDLDGNYGAGIDDGSIISTSQNDAYDGALGLAVDDIAFTNVPDLGGVAFVDTVQHVIQTLQQPASALMMSEEFRFYEDKPIVRLNAQLYNPTSSPISVRVDIWSNLGSDSHTVVDTAATDSASLSDNDRWMVTTDGYLYGDPVLTTVRFGPGNIASHPYFKEKPELGNDIYDDSIRVIVPPFSTRYVVIFNRLDSLTGAARANAGYFNDLQAMLNDSMFAGIDTLDNIVNWSLQQSVASFSASAPAGCNPSTVSFTNNSLHADTYAWNFGDGSPLDSTMSPSHQYMPGAYTVTLTASNGNGMDSTITSTLTVTVPDLTTAVSGNGITITSNAAGAAYQWIDCDNANAAIGGETNQSYTATANGNYAVIVSAGGCTDTSACVAIAAIGLAGHSFTSQVKLYPNPSQGNFTIEVPGSADAVIVIKNALGQVIQKTSTKGNRQVTMNIDQAAGVYFVEVSGEDQQRCVIRLIKE